MSIASLKAAAKASWVWLLRRGLILGGSLMFSLGVPMKMWQSFADHRDGVGYFADPLGTVPVDVWRTLAELSYSSVFLRSKQPTGEGFSAADNSPTAAWGDDGVKVRDRGSYLEFIPSEGGVTTDSGGGKDRPAAGVIILPGALVSPLAYAPLARTMAQKGYSSFVVRFDFDLAHYGWDRVGDIMARAEPEGENCPASPTKWILVGHSMGTMAIEIAMEKSAHKLPKDTEKVVVEGGNHRGFASYNWQPLDWEATITQQEQRRIVVEALCDLIERRVTTAT